MCKYCKLVTDEDTGERLNNNRKFGTIRDGSQYIDLSINRYIDDENDIHRSELVMDSGVSIRSQIYTVQELLIPIKYCPFCGEEL